MSLQLQKAILAAVGAAIAPVKIYVRVPRNASLPYVRIARVTSVPKDGVNYQCDETSFFLEVRSDRKGNSEVRQIIANMKALNFQRLTLDDGSAVTLRRGADTVTQDVDGETFQGSFTLIASE